MHWLACALYIACRNSVLGTVGGITVEGNGVSLMGLLKHCNLNMVQFFLKVKKWADMINLKTEIRDKIYKLECNFAVSYHLFDKYQRIFVDLFQDPSGTTKKSRKSATCTPSELFDFIWTLFVRTKADIPAISDDLLNSHHLLLAVLDLSLIHI